MYNQNHKRLSILLTIVFFMVIFLIPTVHAAEVTLTWNKPDDTRVIGYNIYCGISGTDYTSTPVQTINSVDQTSCLIANLKEGQVYDFTATSLDAEGNESDFAASINYLVVVTPSDNDGDGYTSGEGDCNDNDPSIHPGAIEICGDGIDQDCDGSDLGCLSDPYDIDNDGDGFTENQGDCNDMDPTIYPGASEICGDGIDQNCDGIDLICPEDIDNDGDGYTENEGDCNDNDATIFPGAIEICGDGIDQDCNGSDLVCNNIELTALAVNFQPDSSAVPEGFAIDSGGNFEIEAGFGWINGPASYGARDRDSSESMDQSYDTMIHVFPSSVWEAELPNGSYKVKICMGDPSFPQGIQNVQIEGLSLIESKALSYDNRWIETEMAVDIDDGRLTVTFAGSDDPARLCWIQINANSLTSPENIDNDGDGYTENEGDCNDTDASIFPDAIEICGDGIDQDCDGSDLTCLEDIDNDGDGYTENEGDCNDNDSAIFPGAAEICGDGIDQNCNGSDLVCPEDIDNDGDGFTENQGDCSDNDATIYPGAIEICGDGIDQNCDGMDLECLPDPNDVDNDGDGYTENEGDCNDNDANVFPGAIEICGDGIDQDCDGADLECIEDDIPGFAMETGEAEVNHDWHFVSFIKTFVNPVVVAKPMSLNGGQPAVIRIKNVTPEGFEIRIQEWDYLDGWHDYESVGYMVMEAGHHVLPTGIHVEAGIFESSSALKTVNFDAAFNQTPVLVSGVTTEKEPDAVTGRLSNITHNGFDIMLQEQESSKNGHYADEAVSYIAWEPSSGEVEGLSYIVDSTFNEVTHKFTNIAFYPVFSEAPVFVADMQTTNGADTANVRWQNKTGEGVEVQIDEEQSQNPEVNHVTEVVGYMAFGLAAE